MFWPLKVLYSVYLYQFSHTNTSFSIAVSTGRDRGTRLLQIFGGRRPCKYPRTCLNLPMSGMSQWVAHFSHLTISACWKSAYIIITVTDVIFWPLYKCCVRVSVIIIYQSRTVVVPVCSPSKFRRTCPSVIYTHACVIQWFLVTELPYNSQ